MDLSKAIEKHAAWKIKFRSAITNKETMDAGGIGSDHGCELGVWLHGEGRTRFGALASHASCVSRHASFHAEAGKIARAINAGRYAEAEAMMGSGTPYGEASSAVGLAVMQLKKEAKI